MTGTDTTRHPRSLLSTSRPHIRRDGGDGSVGAQGRGSGRQARGRGVTGTLHLSRLDAVWSLGGVGLVAGGAAPGGRSASRGSRCRLLRRLSLAIFLVFHSTILEPYFNLSLREVEVAGELPALLLGHVGVVQELLLQLQRLELGVGLPLLPDRHVPRPLQRVGAQRACNTNGKHLEHSLQRTSHALI